MRSVAGSHPGRRCRLLIMDSTRMSRPATSRRSRMGTSRAGGVPAVLPAYHSTGHKLATSVAMHFWYDTLLSMAAFAFDPQNQPFVVNFARPL